MDAAPKKNTKQKSTVTVCIPIELTKEKVNTYMSRAYWCCYGSDVQNKISILHSCSCLDLRDRLAICSVVNIVSF
jgi:hypothetical protein